MSGDGFRMEDYIDVAERLQEFRTKYPEGTLQQSDLQFIDFAGQSWVIYTAAAYRTPDDPRPAQGTAWEPVPGRTPFTRDSEVQNAETAAWGRAIVAVGAADTKRGGIASRQEVESRRADREADAGPMSTKTRGHLFALFTQKGPDSREEQLAGINQITGAEYASRGDMTEGHAQAVIKVLAKRPDKPKPPPTPAEESDAAWAEPPVAPPATGADA